MTRRCLLTFQEVKTGLSHKVRLAGIARERRRAVILTSRERNAGGEPHLFEGAEGYAQDLASLDTGAWQAPDHEGQEPLHRRLADALPCRDDWSLPCGDGEG